MKNFMRINCALRTLLATIIFVFFMVPNVVDARPTRDIIISRQKRVSDQRLAELETLLALSRMHGKLVTVPIAFGRVDPTRIGRKRRSNLEYNIQKLQRILQEVARDSIPVSEENNDILTSSWQNDDNRNDHAVAQLI